MTIDEQSKQPTTFHAKIWGPYDSRWIYHIDGLRQTNKGRKRYGVELPMPVLDWLNESKEKAKALNIQNGFVYTNS